MSEGGGCHTGLAPILVGALVLISLSCGKETAAPAPIKEALNTATRPEPSGKWSESGVAVSDVSWRLISLDAAGVRGAYAFTLSNEKNVSQKVFYDLRFVDSGDLVLDRYPSSGNLTTIVDAASNQSASGNFVLDNLATISLANDIAHMGIWASFQPQWDAVVIVSEPQTGIAGEGYVDTLTATGGDGSYSWHVWLGSLPSGLALSAFGIITGTPSARGHEVVTFEAASGGLTDHDVVTFIVIDRPQVTSSVLSNGRVGYAYNRSLSMTGGDIYSGGTTWSLVSGSLPLGLSLSGSGVVSGAPTQVGTWIFRVRVTVYGVAAEKDITITIE